MESCGRIGYINVKSVFFLSFCYYIRKNNLNQFYSWQQAPICVHGSVELHLLSGLLHGTLNLCILTQNVILF